MPLAGQYHEELQAEIYELQAQRDQYKAQRDKLEAALGEVDDLMGADGHYILSGCADTVKKALAEVKP